MTAGIVSGVFLVQRRFTTAVPAQSTLTGTPVTGTVSKTAAALAKTTPETSPETAANTPAPAPVNLTNEELYKLKAPSVVLLQVFDQSGQMTKIGSGFLAGPDRAVITNYHMIRGAYSEKVEFQDGSSADVLGVLGYRAWRLGHFRSRG
jgi:S1-C subfamily serine protease